MLVHGLPSTSLLPDGKIAFGASPYSQANPDYNLTIIKEIDAFIALNIESGKSVSFLDVGCGTGAMMSRIKFRHNSPLISITGIEINPQYVNSAKQFGEVITGDARKYQEYGNYNLIFLYRPLVDSTEQALLEQTIVQQAPPGSLIVSVFPAAPELITPRYRFFEKPDHSLRLPAIPTN